MAAFISVATASVTGLSSHQDWNVGMGDDLVCLATEHQSLRARSVNRL